MCVIKTFLKVTIFSLGMFFVCHTNLYAEVIRKFDSQITVNIDGSIDVVETILYDSEGLDKHGIYRDITPRSSQGGKITVENITIFDSNGVPYIWQQQQNNGDIRLRIGDPDVTFQGQKTYVIQYSARNAVTHTPYDRDEIYWNVTGNKWPFSIERSTASVILPPNVTAIAQACYVGTVGSTVQCYLPTTENGFVSPTTLYAGEGMTVAVGFPVGIVNVNIIPTQEDKVFDFSILLLWPLLVPIGVGIYKFREWYRYGRDPKGRGVIIPQYEVPDNMTPLEVAVILNQTFVARDLIAEILSLATRGYITISQTIKKKFIGKDVTFSLKLKKAPDSGLTDYDHALMKEIFNQDGISPLVEGEEITLSANHSLYAITEDIETKIKNRLVQNDYYTPRFAPKKISFNNPKNWAWMLLYPLLAIGIYFTHNSPLTMYIFIGCAAVSYIIVKLFNRIMPAKTGKGIAAREHLLGLKNYIEVAEKERIAFHNAPEMNATLFEKLLPFAVMFDLEKKWAESFEGIMIEPPSWYSSNSPGFTPLVFASSFSSNFPSSFFMAPSASGSSIGSGGGGFSGGGGGGGGGGSW